MKNSIRFPRLFAAAGATCALLAGPHMLLAQEVVIVTGELRDTAALDLPASVSLLTEDAIRQRDARQLEDLLNLVPNVNYSTGASRGRFIQIRGIGERSQFVAPINPSVGIIVDGIDMTGIANGVTLVDAQQVEVFRGPQGTLHGTNALAGLINVVGRRNDDAMTAELGAGFGDYGRRDFSGAIGLPLSTKIDWRFAGKQSLSDGYIVNEYLGRDDTNDIDELSLRNLFGFSVNDYTQIELISYFIDSDNGYDAFSLDNNRRTLSDQPGRDTQETLANALHATYDGWQVADLNVVLSQADSTIHYSFDEDWSYREICAIDEDCAYWQYSTTDEYDRDNSNTALDLRLLSKSDSSLDWVAGVYRREQDVDLLRTYTNNDPDSNFYSPIDTPEVTLYRSDYAFRNWAVYTQIGFAVSVRMTLSGGLRLARHSADFLDSNGASFEPDEDLTGGRLSLEYRLENNALVYGLVSRGYKVGGFNPDTTLSNDELNFATETMINYEIGSKGEAADGRLQFQVALFYQDRNDIQVKQSRALPVDGVIEFIDFIDNAAEGVNYGLEAELSWLPVHQLELFASLGLLETEYRRFTNGSHVDRDELNGIGVDMSGREQPHAPSYQFLTGAHWDVSQAVSLRFELEGKDGFYFSANHGERASSYVLTNIRSEFRLGNLDLALWVRNLTDKTVETRGFYFSNEFGNDPRKFYAPEPYTQKGAPRTLGLSLHSKF